MSRDRQKPSSKQQTHRCVVVLGEFNSGKTALVNAIVGTEVLKPSFFWRTVHTTVVRFAAKPSLWAETCDGRRVPLPWGTAVEEAAPENTRRLHLGVPLERLANMSVIDTPGFGSADGDADAPALRACRMADDVIWCTPALQAWKASEEQVWLALPDRVRKRGTLAVTFADEIRCQSDADRLMTRLRTEAGPYFRAVATARECAALVAR